MVAEAREKVVILANAGIHPEGLGPEN